MTLQLRIEETLREHRFHYDVTIAAHACSCGQWRDSGPGAERVHHNYREHLAGLLVGVLQPTIETVEALDELPWNAIIRDNEGHEWRHASFHYEEPQFDTGLYWTDAKRRGWPMFASDALPLPCVLLWGAQQEQEQP